jgi:hypothetical protein
MQYDDMYIHFGDGWVCNTTHPGYSTCATKWLNWYALEGTKALWLSKTPTIQSTMRFHPMSFNALKA